MRNLNTLVVVLSLVFLTQISCSGSKTEDKPKNSGSSGVSSGSDSSSSSKVPFAPGFETTRIMEPLQSDGRLDYVSALNALTPDEVNASNNAAVDYWMALGVASLADSKVGAYFKLLGAAPPPVRGPYFRTFEEYAQLDPRVLNDDDALQAKLSMLRGAKRYPWSETDYPDIAKWLDSSRTPLEHVRTGASKEQIYLPIQPLDEDELLDVLTQPSLPRSLDLTDAMLARAMQRVHAVGVLAAWEDLDRCYIIGNQILRAANKRTDLLAGQRILSATLDAEVSVAQFVSLTESQATTRAEKIRVNLEGAKVIPNRVQQFERYRLLDLLAWIAIYREDTVNTSARQAVMLSPIAFLLQTKEPVDWTAAMTLCNEQLDRLEEVENAVGSVDSRKFDAFGKSLDDSLAELGRDLEEQPFGENPAQSAFQSLKDPKQRGHLVALELVKDSLAVARARSEKQSEVYTRYQEALLALGLSAARQAGKVADADWSQLGKAFVPADWTPKSTFYNEIADGYVFRSPPSQAGTRWICDRRALLDTVTRWKPLMDRISFSQQFGGYVDGIDLKETTEVGSLLSQLAYLTLVPEFELRLAAGHVKSPVIAALVTAKSLDLRGTDIKPGDLSSLMRLSRLAELRLDRTAIGDEEMDKIASIKTLENLTLSGVPLTDAGLSKLAGLPVLNHLDVRETKVTVEGVDKIKKALPQCQIEH